MTSELSPFASTFTTTRQKTLPPEATKSKSPETLGASANVFCMAALESESLPDKRPIS
jgi:hypothetical protein